MAIKDVMHIRFAEADKAFIAHQVAQGLFTSETELVRAAVRTMRERQENRFYQAIQAGADDVRHGRTMPLTEALKAEIVENGIKRAKQRKPYTRCDALPDDA
jgi:putative addiction module CopG family antidote